jgi:DNA-binding transcriptional MerR regulator
MNNVDRSTGQPGYRIGAVSRLTGVAPDTLRVWERRYGAVTPFRSDTGTRSYSQEDVGRLALIKRLVDGGDAISCVANLSRDALEERARGAELPQVGTGADRPCRVVVLGASLANRLGEEPSGNDQLELVGSYAEQDELLAQAPGLDPDVLVLEYATIQSEQIREIGLLLLRVGAARAVVVYKFAARQTLERLESPRIVPIRGPVDPPELRRWIRMLHARPIQAPNLLAEAGVDISGPLPSRRFDDATLAKIAAASVTSSSSWGWSRSGHYRQMARNWYQSWRVYWCRNSSISGPGPVKPLRERARSSERDRQRRGAAGRGNRAVEIASVGFTEKTRIDPIGQVWRRLVGAGSNLRVSPCPAHLRMPAP